MEKTKIEAINETEGKDKINMRAFQTTIETKPDFTELDRASATPEPNDIETIRTLANKVLKNHFNYIDTREFKKELLERRRKIFRKYEYECCGNPDIINSYKVSIPDLSNNSYDYYRHLPTKTALNFQDTIDKLERELKYDEVTLVIKHYSIYLSRQSKEV